MNNQIDARELTSDVLPKLKATRHLIEHTLKARIEKSNDEEERRKLTHFQQEFETMVIQLNLDHLLTRSYNQLKAAAEGREPSKSPPLALDQSEAHQS